MRTCVSPEVMVLTLKDGRFYYTHVFGGVLDTEELKSYNWSQAVAAHDYLVDWCREGLKALEQEAK